MIVKTSWKISKSFNFDSAPHFCAFEKKALFFQKKKRKWNALQSENDFSKEQERKIEKSSKLERSPLLSSFSTQFPPLLKLNKKKNSKKEEGRLLIKEKKEENKKTALTGTFFSKKQKKTSKQQSKTQSSPSKSDSSSSSKFEKEAPLFLNCSFDKGRLKSYIFWCFRHYGQRRTVNLLAELKSLGFGYATKAGISISIDDLKIPPTKAKLLSSAELDQKTTALQYEKGQITNLERFQNVLETWHNTSELLKEEMINHFKETDVLNPVYMMAFSGARGNVSQVRQLVGMRGLMSDPQGQILDYPIRSNFREGLTLTEYVISCYGARKGVVDTALRTADAGYLTRRLVDVAHQVVVSNFDCGTQKGLLLMEMKSGNKKLFPLNQRLLGRVLAADIFSNSPISSEKKGEREKEENSFYETQSKILEKKNIKLFSRNTEINEELATKIAEIRDRVYVRSPLGCILKKKICKLCYGWSLSDGQLVSVGEAVGILAAQSIGEPGTQLTMRTFHTGGVFSGEDIEQITASFDGKIEFTAPVPGSMVRDSQGKIVFLTKGKGELILRQIPSGLISSLREKSSALLQSKEEKTVRYKIPESSLLYVRNKQKVIKGELVARLGLQMGFSDSNLSVGEYLVKSKIEGEVCYADVDFSETTLPPIDLVNQSLNWGSISILSGQIVTLPFDSNFFPETGDFLNENCSVSQTQWMLHTNAYLSNVSLDKPEKLSFLQRKESSLSSQDFREKKMFNMKFQKNLLSLPKNTKTFVQPLSEFKKTSFSPFVSEDFLKKKNPLLVQKLFSKQERESSEVKKESLVKKQKFGPEMVQSIKSWRQKKKAFLQKQEEKILTKPSASSKREESKGIFLRTNASAFKLSAPIFNFKNQKKERKNSLENVVRFDKPILYLPINHIFYKGLGYIFSVSPSTSAKKGQKTNFFIWRFLRKKKENKKKEIKAQFLDLTNHTAFQKRKTAKFSSLETLNRKDVFFAPVSLSEKKANKENFFSQNSLLLQWFTSKYQTAKGGLISQETFNVRQASLREKEFLNSQKKQFSKFFPEQNGFKYSFLEEEKTFDSNFTKKRMRLFNSSGKKKADFSSEKTGFSSGTLLNENFSFFREKNTPFCIRKEERVSRKRLFWTPQEIYNLENSEKKNRENFSSKKGPTFFFYKNESKIDLFYKNKRGNVSSIRDSFKAGHIRLFLKKEFLKQKKVKKPKTSKKLAFQTFSKEKSSKIEKNGIKKEKRKGHEKKSKKNIFLEKKEKENLKKNPSSVQKKKKASFLLHKGSLLLKFKEILQKIRKKNFSLWKPISLSLSFFLKQSFKKVKKPLSVSIGNENPFFFLTRSSFLEKKVSGKFKKQKLLNKQVSFQKKKRLFYENSAFHHFSSLTNGEEKKKERKSPLFFRKESPFSRTNMNSAPVFFRDGSLLKNDKRGFDKKKIFSFLFQSHPFLRKAKKESLVSLKNFLNLQTFVRQNQFKALEALQKRTGKETVKKKLSSHLFKSENENFFASSPLSIEKQKKKTPRNFRGPNFAQKKNSRNNSSMLRILTKMGPKFHRKVQRIFFNFRNESSFSNFSNSNLVLKKEKVRDFFSSKKRNGISLNQKQKKKTKKKESLDFQKQKSGKTSSFKKEQKLSNKKKEKDVSLFIQKAENIKKEIRIRKGVLLVKPGWIYCPINETSLIKEKKILKKKNSILSNKGKNQFLAGLSQNEKEKKNRKQKKKGKVQKALFLKDKKEKKVLKGKALKVQNDKKEKKVSKGKALKVQNDKKKKKVLISSSSKKKIRKFALKNFWLSLKKSLFFHKKQVLPGEKMVEKIFFDQQRVYVECIVGNLASRFKKQKSLSKKRFFAKKKKVAPQKFSLFIKRHDFKETLFLENLNTGIQSENFLNESRKRTLSFRESFLNKSEQKALSLSLGENFVNEDENKGVSLPSLIGKKEKNLNLPSMIGKKEKNLNLPSLIKEKKFIKKTRTKIKWISNGQSRFSPSLFFDKKETNTKFKKGKMTSKLEKQKSSGKKKKIFLLIRKVHEYPSLDSQKCKKSILQKLTKKIQQLNNSFLLQKSYLSDSLNKQSRTLKLVSKFPNNDFEIKSNSKIDSFLSKKRLLKEFYEKESFLIEKKSEKTENTENWEKNPPKQRKSPKKDSSSLKLKSNVLDSKSTFSLNKEKDLSDTPLFCFKKQNLMEIFLSFSSTLNEKRNLEKRRFPFSFVTKEKAQPRLGDLNSKTSRINTKNFSLKKKEDFSNYRNLNWPFLTSRSCFNDKQKKNLDHLTSSSISKKALLSDNLLFFLLKTKNKSANKSKKVFENASASLLSLNAKRTSGKRKFFLSSSFWSSFFSQPCFNWSLTQNLVFGTGFPFLKKQKKFSKKENLDIFNFKLREDFDSSFKKQQPSSNFSLKREEKSGSFFKNKNILPYLDKKANKALLLEAHFKVNEKNVINENKPFVFTHFLSPCTGEVVSHEKRTLFSFYKKRRHLILTRSDLLSFVLPLSPPLLKKDEPSNFKKNQSKRRAASLLIQNKTSLQKTEKKASGVFHIGQFFFKGDSIRINQTLSFSKKSKKKKNKKKDLSKSLHFAPVSVGIASESGRLIHMNRTKITIRKAQPLFFSPKCVFHAQNGEFVSQNVPVLSLPYSKKKTGDIVQGIPKIEQLFEARLSFAGEKEEDSLPNLLKILYHNYKQKLPIKIAVRKAIKIVSTVLANSIQRVYRSQGVSVSDKHIEVIVKQMTNCVQIIHPGTSNFFRGEQLSLLQVESWNSKKPKRQKIRYEPLLLGISKASLQVDSFLSAASFQYTTRVLKNAAFERKIDFLNGLKENIIIGNIIPAGTGFLNSTYTNRKTEKEKEKEKERKKRVELFFSLNRPF
uniref:DNA-directed RNA polymerase subunit beta'' n=1 Tax=Floydiella terrestris TaxID=51328 RepID=E2DSP3_FLOTE|nr:beta' subunit of RNA polymerase [Floydiella terrestris]ACZ58496.1 beta' subunit of RNA polymerase [Floydiella terrestris]